MAERNKNKSLFEKQQEEILEEVKTYKLGAEANIVSLIYKNPDLLRENNLSIDDFHENCWKVYFEIARDMVFDKMKTTLSEPDVLIFLDSHKKLAKRFDEYGGYDTVVGSWSHVDERNFEGYLADLRKWNATIKLIEKGFPCDKDKLREINDGTIEDLYADYTIHLNDIFANVDNNVKAYNGFEGMHELIEELDKGKNRGIKLVSCEMLDKEIGGLLGGNIIGMGASSGVGKSTLSINYIFPSMIKYGLRALFIINEEDENKFKQEALVWYCTNISKYPIPKHVLRKGDFDEETKAYLHDAAEWFESQKELHNITIIPLEQYTSKTVVKLIKKYTKMGIDVICVDTLKESYDSRNKESWKSLMTDCVDFYDCIKHTDTCMVITYQLVKNKSKYLTNADIGVSKGIIDVFSVNLFFRRPLQTELEGGSDELYCYRPDKSGFGKVEFKLKKDEHYMITFISKNRFGQSDIQIVSEADFSINKYEDLGYCKVIQDY